MLGILHSEIRDSPPLVPLPHTRLQGSPPQYTPSAPTSSSQTLSEKLEVIEDSCYFITDSHGNLLHPKRMYTGKVTAKVKTLSQKTILDASEYIKKISIKKSVITYIIGSNDLTKCSAQKTAERCKTLLNDSAVRFPGCQIVLYGIPPRKPSHRWLGYEEKRSEYNTTMEKFCTQMKGLHFAKTTVIIDQLKDDEIHLKPKEIRTVVMDLKKVINPLVGLKAYEEYSPVGTNSTLSECTINMKHQSLTPSSKPKHHQNHSERGPPSPQETATSKNSLKAPTHGQRSSCQQPPPHRWMTRPQQPETLGGTPPPPLGHRSPMR
jgi:hypothetical protein